MSVLTYNGPASEGQLSLDLADAAQHAEAVALMHLVMERPEAHRIDITVAGTKRPYHMTSEYDARMVRRALYYSARRRDREDAARLQPELYRLLG
jgi:hypothetical protein